VVLTHRFHASLTAVAVVASGHLLAYGLSQLPWVALLARCGPVLTMRIAMGGAGLCAGIAALAPNLGWLIAARVAGGAFLGAAVPAALLYVGTRLPTGDRPRGFAAIVSANGLGIVLAVAIAIVATSTDVWRVAYLLTGGALLLCAVAVTGLSGRDAVADSEPSSHPDSAGSPRGQQVGRVVRTLVLVLIEGVLVLGAVIVLPALASQGGHSRQVAAATVAVFGITMPLTGSLLQRWPLRFTLAARVPVAAGLLCLLPLTALVWERLAGVVFIAMLLGVAWSVLHPVLQAAATSAWPGRTPAVLALFVTALFVGGAVGSQALATVASGHGGAFFTMACAGGGLLLLCVERLTRRVTQ
jgi:MFS family permease